MGDTMRLVTIAPSGRPLCLRDLNGTNAITGGGIVRQRDTFDYALPTARVQALSSDDRYAGDELLPGPESNATVASRFTVKDTNSLRAALALERLVNDVLEVAPSRPVWIEWRPENLPRSVYFRVRGRAAAKPAYRAGAWARSSAAMTEVEVSWPVAPLAEGLPMTVLDAFDAPSDREDGLVNLLRNPSFETDLNGWSQYTGGAVTIATFDRFAATFTGSKGANVLRVISVAALPAGGVMGGFFPSVIGQYQMPVRAGATYAVAAAMRLHAGANTNTQCSLLVEWWTASGGVLGYSPDILSSVGAGDKALSGIVQAPAGAAFVRVYPRAAQNAVPSAAAVTLYIDAVMCSEVPAGTTTAPAYIDGDQGNARWEDVSHASRSIELTEDKLTEYTLDEDLAAVLVRQDSRAVDPPGGLVATATAGRSRLRHTGRGYGLRTNLAVAAMFATPAAFAALFQVGAGKAVTPIGLYYARVDESGAARSLNVVREVNGVETILATSASGGGSGALAALSVSRVYWIRFVQDGKFGRGELWQGPPNLAELAGAAPLAFTPFVALEDTTSQPAGGPSGPGDAVLVYAPRTLNGGRVMRFLVEPYAWTARVGAYELDLDNVPGNAPARFDIDVHTADATVASIELAAYKRPAGYNVAPNGDLEDGTDYWTNATLSGGLAAGGAVARVATGGPINNGPYANITTPATTATGAALRVMRRFSRGTVYSVEFYAWNAGGAWEAFAAGDSAVDTSAGAVPVGAAWARYAYQWTPTDDREVLELIFRKTAAGLASDTLRVAGLRIYEGPVGPGGINQSEGRGAFPPVGLLLAEGDVPSVRLLFAAATDAAAPTGRSIARTSVAVNELARAEWPIDLALYAEGDQTDETLELEAYLVGTQNATGSVLLTASYAPARLPSGPRVYTTEYGSAGKLLVTPTGTVVRCWRLGTIALGRDLRRPAAGRGRLRVDALLSAIGTVFSIHSLMLLPVRRRAGSPTGKTNDASFPVFIAGETTTGYVKTVREDGRGALAKTTGRDETVDAGIAGARFTLEPGANTLAVLPVRGVIDDPAAAAVTIPAATMGYSVHVTPRYRILRAD